MAVTTKKITTVDTATTFDDVFVNNDGTLRQVPKADFQQASGIATNTEDIATNKKDIATNKKDIATNTAAITALNSRTAITVYSNVDVLETMKTVAQGVGLHHLQFGSGLTNAPGNQIYFEVVLQNYRAFAFGNNWMATSMWDKGSWSSWTMAPTRNEFDTLNSRIGNRFVTASSSSNYNTVTIKVTDRNRWGSAIFSHNNHLWHIYFDGTNSRMTRIVGDTNATISYANETYTIKTEFEGQPFIMISGGIGLIATVAFSNT